jgi:BON domain
MARANSRGARRQCWRLFGCAVGLAFVCACPAFVSAQFTGSSAGRAGTTSTGMFGSTTVGGTTSINPQASRTGGGTSPSGIGGATGTGQPGAMGLGAAQMVGMQNGLPLQQQNFVGSTAANTANLLSRQGTQGAVQPGRVNFGTLTNLMNQSRQNQFNQQQAQRNTRTANQAQGEFRVPLRVGFQPQPIAAGRAAAGFNTRLAKLPGLSQAGSVTATLEGRTAVLRGTVATEADRQLAEGLARLEPEVMAVRNELVVGQLPSTSGALPPGTTPSGP